MSAETTPLELPDPTLPGAAPVDWPLDHPRAINDILALLDSTWLSPETFARPTHYDIAVSVVCNIKCPFCPRQTFGDEIRSGLMQETHFVPVIPHLEVSQRTGLYGLGEPFLNKKFFQFLGAAKDQGSYCMTSSHGMSLTSERIDEILDSGLDELCVSMDGATERTFNFLRSGADYRTVLANVRELLRRRAQRGQRTPRLHIAMAVSKYNVWEMTRMVHLAKEIGADKVAYSNLVLDHPEHEHASIVGTRIFRFNHARAIRAGERVGMPTVFFYQIPFPWKDHAPPPIEPGVRYGCPSAWRQLIIERDGNIKPCCYLDLSIGNTASKPLEEQFNSPEAVALRQTFLDRQYHEKCKGCGQFMQVTDAVTEQSLSDARERIESGKFSDGVRERLRHVLGHYRQLAARALATK